MNPSVTAFFVGAMFVACTLLAYFIGRGDERRRQWWDQAQRRAGTVGLDLVRCYDNFMCPPVWTDDEKARYRAWLVRMGPDHPSNEEDRMPWEPAPARSET